MSVDAVIRECEACPKCGLTINGLCRCPPEKQTEAQAPERVWIARPIEFKSLISKGGPAFEDDVEYVRTDLTTAGAVSVPDAEKLRAVAHKLLRRFMGVYDTGDLDDAITILQGSPSAGAGTEDAILRKLTTEHSHVRFVEGVCGGVQPLINGTRVGVSHLLGRMAIGMSIDEYKETWSFDDETVRDAFAYAQDVIDALIEVERRAATEKRGK